MLTCPPEPRPGEPITATFMASLVRYVKASTPLPGPNTKISRGPNGSVINAAPFVAGKSSGGIPLRPWHITTSERNVTVSGQTQKKTIHVFADCYYMAGQVMRHYTPKDDEAVEDFVCKGDLPEGEEYTDDDNPFICFRYLSGKADSSSSEYAIVGYKNYEDMRFAMMDRIYSTIPLYKLTHTGDVKLDFRSPPFSQEFEMI